MSETSGVWNGLLMMCDYCKVDLINVFAWLHHLHDFISIHFLSLLQMEIWRRFRELSIVDYSRIYGRLHVSFDEYAGESQYVAGANHVAAMLDAKGACTDE